MMRSVVAEPLLSKVNTAAPGTQFEVIVWLNETYELGMAAALREVEKRAKEWGVQWSTTSHYCFACLTREQILELAAEVRALMAAGRANSSVVYRIWDDTDIHVSLTKSVVTVKADAAQRAFQARGDEITWAVLDSGIQGDHPHFKTFNTLASAKPLEHQDFTSQTKEPLVDLFGHGSHVAGIIAGAWTSPSGQEEQVVGTELRNEQSPDQPLPQLQSLACISGIAPRCKLVSMKVVADRNVPAGAAGLRRTAGQGKVSWVLQAIDQIQTWNQNGKRLLIHGVNMSLGYAFDPRWFGCGQSPLCVEVNRLVKSGVVVVVAAGNAGYGSFLTALGKAEQRYSDLTITDPGNAELAITVGSTHREMPHIYGVSYFSSRGPTGDGRMKPDLVAPGERIISCAAGVEKKKYGDSVLYCEQTGTSMAAPHVSGAVAAFLSVRREYIGCPEDVKDIFLGNTVDLRRQREFQGAGLLDLMKVLQAV
jgi:subtilisin family serine protease